MRVCARGVPAVCARGRGAGASTQTHRSPKPPPQRCSTRRHTARMFVLKRDGRKEAVSLDKVHHRIKT